MDSESFKKLVLGYYRAYGRHDLPWRKTKDPYRILVSEIMLQQTQVSRVLHKYEELLAAFPTVDALAKAPQAQVLKLWQGLGYNRRALNLKRAAEAVVTEYGGKFPRTAEELESLPGIGQSTRGALMAFAFGIATPFIETNIRAVYIHSFFPKARKIDDKRLWPLIEETLDQKDPRSWYYALMDYGVHLKAKHPNPSRKSKHHAKQSKFEGSHRQSRAKLLRFILERPRTSEDIRAEFGDISKALQELVSEGFVTEALDNKRKRYTMA